MADKSKPLPVWFGPALVVSGLLALFSFVKKGKTQEEKP